MSYVDEESKPNVVYLAGVALRIADNLDLAVEHTRGARPRNPCFQSYRIGAAAHRGSLPTCRPATTADAG
jgi:hypothetical protein